MLSETTSEISFEWNLWNFKLLALKLLVLLPTEIVRDLAKPILRVFAQPQKGSFDSCLRLEMRKSYKRSHNPTNCTPF